MTLRRAVRRLRLKEGDILLCRDPNMLDALMGIHDPKIPPVAILITEAKHSLQVTSKEELRRLLELAEAQCQ
jgi:hypothetical protein